MRGWITLTDGIKEINVWRWTVIEHYSLERFHEVLRGHFPTIKGFTVGFKLFQLPAEDETWGERRVNQVSPRFSSAFPRLFSLVACAGAGHSAQQPGGL